MKPIFSVPLLILACLYLAPEFRPTEGTAVNPAASGSRIASISGNIHRANGAPLPGIEVNLTGNSIGQQFTDTNGDYAFPGLADGFDYTITPQWQGTCNSPCITVYDLYLIQQHILGVTALPSPYALIAADANNSGGITTQDYVQIRSLILGDINQFPTNSCWRFVDAGYPFPDPFDPFTSGFPEVANINNLTGDVQADFIGVQVGDVSDCMEMVGASNLVLFLEAADVYCTDELALVQVRVQGFTDISGLQFTIKWDPAIFEYANVLNFGLPGLTAANFSQFASSGELTMVWTDPSGLQQTLADGSLLFNLYLNPIISANVPTIIYFSDTPSLPLAIDATGQPGFVDGQIAATALESPELAVGPAYCYNGLQFASFYAEGNMSPLDGDNVFQDRGNNGWMVYNLADNGAIFMQALYPTPPFCGTLYNEMVSTCAAALVPDCEQPVELAPSVEPDASLQVQGNKVVWVSDQDGDRDIYAYDLATGTLTNVSDNAADDQFPNLHGDRIVWRGNESGNYEIWAYDCQTQFKQQVSQNSTDVDQSPAVFGNYVTWRSNQDGDNDIYLYNLVTGLETNLSNDNATGAGSPAIFGDWVVWESTDQGPDVDVFLYTISIQNMENLSNSAEDEQDLVLQGDVAAWAAFDMNTFAYDLFAYQLATGTLVPVANDVPLSLNSLAVGGDYVVWADNSDGDNEIYAYRLSDGTTLQLSNNTDEDNRPAIHAGQVVWEAFEGGDREIRYHNLESGRTAILGPDPAVDLFPDTYGPFSVWQSDRDGNGQYELYFFNTQLLPPQQVQLDAGASVTTGLCPGENATLVLETAGPGLEAVWFDDDMMSNELYADAANLFEPVVSGPTTFYGAWRDPITGCIAPLAAAAVVAEPTDILGCNDMFSINLSDFCQATLDASILEGVFGCLQADDFVIDVQDINPGNGPVVDEAGSYVYTVDLAPGVTANFTGCFGMVEAQDGLPPILTCPDDLTVQAPPGAMEASVNAPIPTWDDNCAVDASTLMVTTPFNPSDPFPVGQTTMGFSIMDVSGNLGECSYIVEVLPASADVILEVGSNVTTVGNQVCVDVTVQNFADVAAMQFTLEYDPALLGNPSVTDIGLPGFNNSNYAFPAPGFITFSWFTSPAVTLPDGSVIFQLCFDALMEGLSPLNITGSPTPLEISDGNSNALPVTANPGSITINGALVLACPNDIVQPNNPGICEALINIPVPTMPGPGTLVNSYTGGDNASGLYPVGVTTVTYTFFGAGDTLMCSFTVEVQDIEPPIIICPASLQVDGEAAAGGATVNFPAPAVADNCPVAVLDCNHLSGELFPCGPTTVTCTATDTSGNQSECAFTVAVNCSPDTCCLDFNGVTIVDPLNLTGGLADTGFDFIDADNDGDQDIIAYNTVGVLAIIRNQPPYDPPNFELFNPIALFYNAISPSTLDYNQDGFEDFFALELGTNEVIYYENQGIIGTPAFNVIPTGLVLPPQATDIAVGDLGNDGIADLLVHLNVGGINAVYYEGGCQAPVIPCFTLVGNDYATPFIDLPLAPVTSTNKFELFDGDCDGDLDLFMADGDALSLNPVVWYFENYGGVTPSGSLPNVENVNYLTDPFGLTGWSSNSDAVLLRLADVDNDQQAEAFLDAGSMSYFDNFCLTADSCCVDSLAFADLVAQGFTVTLNDSCGVTVTAPQFNSCHWFTTPPDWGDGTGTFQVVVPANGTWMYTYAQGGTYDICVTVFEADSLGATPCWSAQMCTTVTVNCDCPDISLTPSPSVPDSSLVGCCWNLAYSNAGADTVYGIRLIPLDGVDLSVHNEEPDFMVTSTINGALIVPTGFGPMPPSAPTLADICLNHVLATPQYVAVQYMDGALMPFCFDTLVFNCPVEETCLYIVTDSLKCDTNGYKYVATVTNPSGADFPVKYVKLNVTSGPPGLSLLPQAGIELPDTLYQGDTTMVMWNFPTDEDWFGDTLCFILSAHDGPEERLCCAEIDTCLAFPACDPCKYKDVAVAVSTLPGTGGGGDCFGGNPLLEPWLQDLIAGCAGDPCGMLVYCCLYQGQPVVNVQDDDMACSDSGGTVYDYQGNPLFFYGGIAGINLNLYAQLEDCTLIFECSQLGDCCYSLLTSNNHPEPGFFTSIHVNILTPGISFSAIDYDPGYGWSFSPAIAGQSAYTWAHNSGSVPLMVDYHLFDFCLEGTTTTGPISIEVQWQRNDSTLCRDTIEVFCPECVVVTDEEISCDSAGVYTYTFSGQNWSDYEVNAVGFVEVPPPGYEIVEEAVSLPFLVPTGGGAFGPLSVTILSDSLAAGDTLCFDIVLRQIVGDSIDILCCYARHCIVMPPCDTLIPCPDILCLAPPDVTEACSNLPAFDPTDPAELQPLFGTAAAGGNCPGATWQELPPTVNLTDCAGGTIVRTFQAFDGAGNPSTNPCTQTVTLQGDTLNYGIRFPADADVDCAGLDALDLEILGGSCGLFATTFSDLELSPPPGACRQLARTWRVINFCEYDGVSAPVVVGRDENCNGTEGEEDIWVLVGPGGMSYFDQDSDETNAAPAAGVKGTSCDGLTNPAGYWVDSAIKPAIASVGAWEYTQVITLTEDCVPPTDLVCIATLALEIQPLAVPVDIDGDGDIDDAAATLTPGEVVILPATDDCSPPVTYSINLEGQTPDPGQGSISFSCDQLGTAALEIHAWDAAGNHDYCQLGVAVNDTQGLCGNLAAREEVRLQPNPATDELLVRSRRQGSCRMDILSPEGPVHQTREARFRGQAIGLSLQGLPPGLYLLRLRYADGHTVVRRFVKM